MTSSKVQIAAIWIRAYEFAANNLEYVRRGSIEVRRIYGVEGLYKYKWQGYSVTRSQAIQRLSREV